MLLNVRALFAMMALSLAPAAEAEGLRDALPQPFCGRGQQDASELCRVLLEVLATQGMGRSGEGRRLGKQVRWGDCMVMGLA